MIPVLLATKTVVPDSKNGAVKSTAASRSAFTFNEVKTMSNFFSTKAFISPFHWPFCVKKEATHTFKKDERGSVTNNKNIREAIFFLDFFRSVP